MGLPGPDKSGLAMMEGQRRDRVHLCFISILQSFDVVPCNVYTELISSISELVSRYSDYESRPIQGQVVDSKPTGNLPYVLWNRVKYL